MAARMANKDHNGEDEDEDDKGGGESGSGRWIPSYYELLGISADEKELTGLTAEALFELRLAIKAQGYDVTALSKIQQFRNKLNDVGLDNANDGGGIDLEAHPELAELGGDIDPNLIVLPESELIAAAKNDPQLRNRLVEQYKQKMKMRAQLLNKPKPSAPEPRPAPTPRYRPTNAPKNRPT